MSKIYIVKSGSFSYTKDVDDALVEIEEMLEPDDEVINIQLIEYSGLYRLFAYCREKVEPLTPEE